jgi:Lrp/AsnC family leucine-responsive transcriptional regulator
VCIEVMLERSSPDVFERFKEAARERPEILECYLIAGDFDYLLKTRVSDMDAYREFLHKVLQALPGVRETRSYVVMEEVKSTQALQVE